MTVLPGTSMNPGRYHRGWRAFKRTLARGDARVSERAPETPGAGPGAFTGSVQLRVGPDGIAADLPSPC
jgi:hypothetical protein